MNIEDAKKMVELARLIEATDRQIAEINRRPQANSLVFTVEVREAHSGGRGIASIDVSRASGMDLIHTHHMQNIARMKELESK